MKHELFKIEADYNKREEEYYTEKFGFKFVRA